MRFLATDQLSACETRQKGLIQIIELLMVLPAAAAQPSQGRLQLRAQNCAISHDVAQHSISRNIVLSLVDLAGAV